MQRASYEQAGVDIAAGDQAVELIRRAVASTETPGMLGTIGGFGGCFRPNLEGLRDPILVSGTDGVGTKLKIAFMTGRHDTVGIDCVAMCVNDVAAMGADPLFFLDYIALGHLVPERVAEVVEGVAAGCRQAHCALVGGETAEMPGFYPPDEYDLAGFCVGLVDREWIVDGHAVKAGDVIVGLPSSGLHSNGFSLVRHVVFDRCGLDVDSYVPELGRTVGEELLEPTIIYVDAATRARNVAPVRGMAHITGGGLLGNIPRIIPYGLRAQLDLRNWQIPPVFVWLTQLGNLDETECYQTFNMGIGFVLVVPQASAGALCGELAHDGARVIGTVVPGDAGVELVR
ncbi:MAG: phosphoribosylformylglycinamidine cyclo-ligase [Candidatus Cryosericum sp.]|nr:phosphoribosylformylglycinamidine cyclo-ligase [bacterium]